MFCFKMGPFIFILYVLPIVSSITISPNGNSPEIKMRRGMMVDVKKPASPIAFDSETSAQKLVEKTAKLNTNSKLSINERYRRLIPYMTFYYANDLALQTPKPEPVHNIVEVEKAEIVEAQTIAQNNQRQTKKIIQAHRNIPRYQGNRLTQYNIASANPPKLFYKDVSNHHNSIKFPNYNGGAHQPYGQYEYERYIQKPHRDPTAAFSPSSARKPYNNINKNEGHAQQYYLGEKPIKYKLVPYDQTPPISVTSQNDHFHHVKIPEPVPVLLNKDPIYVKSRQPPTQLYFNHPVNIPHAPSPARKPPTVVSESYYDNRHPQMVQPIIEGGFKPIIHHLPLTTEAPIYISTLETPHRETEKPRPIHVIETSTTEIDELRYYDYSADKPQISAQFASNKLNLGELINSLQISHSIPKTITRENVGASIRTLLHVLNALKAEQNEVDTPVLSTPKPFVVAEVDDPKPHHIIVTSPATVTNDLHEEPYLAHVNTPSQHLDDFPTGGGTSQRFPQPVSSDDEGGTPGTPGVDYPILSTIPQTSFDCKTQRYKGFFADPDTRCQVWHYCDLNGGQASFLCPNGTIFSQAGLTCDWWFNVRCASTTQLYVLNESLYKFILPHSPKFPEDYSGPLVDKYLTLKFKEMEEQFKKNKNKQTASEKIDSEGSEETTGSSSEDVSTEDNTENTETISEASVIVESPGTSGNVQRLQDEN